MRVGLLLYGSLDTISGGYLYDRKLVEHLRSQGDQVELISLPWRGYARHLGDNFSQVLLQRLAGLQVDVLLQDELNHPSLFWLNHRLRRRARYPLISIVHHLRSSEQHPAWLLPLYRAVERRYLQSVHGFIFNSRTTHQAVQALSGRSAPAVIAYPAGNQLGAPIQQAEIAHRAQEGGPLRVLFVGNLIPRKGLHDLLRAIALLPEGACCLAVAGRMDADPAYARRVQQLANDLGLQAQVQFLGAVSDETLVGHLRNSHLLAVPSTYEGFGIVYLEGMGFGLPALATRLGAASELVTHAENGFLLPPGDPQALSQAIHALHSDRRLLASMGTAALERFRAHPTWQHSAGHMRAFLQEQTSPR